MSATTNSLKTSGRMPRSAKIIATVALSAMLGIGALPAQANSVSVTAKSAGSKSVGATANAWGAVSGFNGKTVTVRTQVKIGNKWSTSQSRRTTGQYTIPLTYGANKAGTYTYRVTVTDGNRTAVSKQFTFKRTATKSAAKSSASRSVSSSTAALSGVWKALAQCESGGNPRIVSSNGMYHGLYQFSVSTWRSVGGSGLPSQASVAEQTKRAQMLQAKAGWGQWPHCSRKIGVR